MEAPDPGGDSRAGACGPARGWVGRQGRRVMTVPTSRPFPLPWTDGCRPRRRGRA